MGLVIPGRGWSWAFYQETATTVYGLLGPFAGVDVVKEVRISVSASANGQARVGFVYGPVGQANAASFEAGTSIIQRSNANVGDGHPEWWIGVSTYRTFDFAVPCGFRGGTGSQFIIARVYDGTSGTMLGLVSAHVVRVVADVREV